MATESKNYTKLYQTYKGIRLYKEKLKFFDEQFGLIPLSYPEFQCDIKSFLDKVKMDELLELFEKEKAMSSDILKKKIEERETELVFNITPENSNRQYFNDYILNKFVFEDKIFQKEIEYLNGTSGLNKDQIAERLIEVTNKADAVKERIRMSKERNYKNQFINVFLNGFSDYQFNNIKQFSYKKRFIELYLYAQGILHAKYIEELKKRTSPLLTAFRMALPFIINSMPVLDDISLDILFSDQCFLLN